VDLVAQVHEMIIREELLRPGEAVVVGVSGGVDSMVLIEMLRRIGAWKLHVAHFNHQLRGAESDADEHFVRSEAERLGLPFISERGDVKGRAADRGVSIEMAARELRYEFLESAAERIRAERIVLAHHGDDQVETFWMRLLRGDVGPGLAGMRWKRPANAKGNLHIVRPLLRVAKHELIEFAQANKVEFREDSSNRSIDIQRNRLRLEIIPQMEKFQPGLRQISRNVAEVLAAEKDFLETGAREWLARSGGDFSRLHKALQREVIRVQLVAMELKPSFDLIETLRLSAEVPVSVSSEGSVRRDETGRVRRQTNEPLAFQQSECAIEFQSEGSASIEDCWFKWRLIAERGAACANVEYFDAAQIGSAATIRHWRAGDRFQPIGFEQTAKLQDLFTNAKVPADQKRRKFVAVDSVGRIFWVEGLRISETHKVTAQTTQVLEWSWRHESES
jgi:tRNA(Ile)-lysidine synthase